MSNSFPHLWDIYLEFIIPDRLFPDRNPDFVQSRAAELFSVNSYIIIDEGEANLFDFLIYKN